MSSLNDISSGYRKLAKDYHPDNYKGPKEEANKLFKELVDAYQRLSNEDSRKVYDNQEIFQFRQVAKGREPSKGSSGRRGPARKSFVEKIKDWFTGGGDDEVLDPKQANTHFALGLSYIANPSMYPQAEQSFRAAIKYDKTYAEAHYNLALILYKLGRFDEAREEFKKILELNPRDGYADKMIQLLSE